jgi:hypothetical protein
MTSSPTRIVRGLGATALACACLLAAGCGKKGPNDRPHVSGTPHTDDVVNAWKSAGLSTEGFTSIDPAALSAANCSQGRLAGIDALVCEYSDDASLDRATKSIQAEWNKVGIQTGVALRSKHTLMAIADRSRIDPNGRTISKAVDAFKKL